MFKKITVLVLAFCFLQVGGLSSSTVADNLARESCDGEPSAKPGEIELPRELDPLRGAIFETCTAQQNCPDPFDGPIMCTGTNSCQVYSYRVSCDGDFVDCSCSIAPSGCIDPLGYCWCRSRGATHLQCTQWHCIF